MMLGNENIRLNLICGPQPPVSVEAHVIPIVLSRPKVPRRLGQYDRAESDALSNIQTDLPTSSTASRIIWSSMSMWTGTHLTAQSVCRSANRQAFATASRLTSRPTHQLHAKPLRSLYVRSPLFSLPSKPLVSSFTSFSKLHADNAPIVTSQASGPKSNDIANISPKEQRKKDWMIVRRLMSHVWPKHDWKTRARVVLGFGLLIAGKVCMSI